MELLNTPFNFNEYLWIELKILICMYCIFVWLFDGQRLFFVDHPIKGLSDEILTLKVPLTSTIFFFRRWAIAPQQQRNRQAKLATNNLCRLLMLMKNWKFQFSISKFLKHWVHSAIDKSRQSGWNYCFSIMSLEMTRTFTIL